LRVSSDKCQDSANDYVLTVSFLLSSSSLCQNLISFKCHTNKQM